MQTYSVSREHSHLHDKTVKGQRGKFWVQTHRDVYLEATASALPPVPGTPMPLCSIRGGSSPRGVAVAGHGRGCGCHLALGVRVCSREPCCSQPTPESDGSAPPWVSTQTRAARPDRPQAGPGRCWVGAAVFDGKSQWGYSCAKTDRSIASQALPAVA